MEQKCDVSAHSRIDFELITMLPDTRKRVRSDIAACAERNGKDPTDFTFDSAVVLRDGSLMISYQVVRSDGETLTRFDTTVRYEEWLLGSLY